MKPRKERCVAFIVARLDSSRFPEKQLRKIGTFSSLSWTLFNLRKAHEIDEIVLATVATEANRPLRDFASQNSIPCFWYQGDPNHVTTRLCKAAEKFAAEIGILISGDCPLVDGEAIDQLITQFRSHPEKDYTILPPDSQHRDCLLQGVSVARISSWQRAEQLSTTPELKEHHFPIMPLRNQDFHALPCHISMSIYGEFHRLSIDTFADLHFFQKTHNLLLEENLEFDLVNVVAMLDRNPELKEINEHVYQRKLHETIPKIAFVYMEDGLFEDKEFFSFEDIVNIGLRLVELKGWPVHFLTNSQKLMDKLTHHGLIFSEINTIPDIYNAIDRFPQKPHLILDNFHHLFSKKIILDLISKAYSLILIHEKEYSQQKDKKILSLYDLPQNEPAFYESAKRIIEHIEAYAPEE